MGEHVTVDSLGSPLNPLTKEELEEKFRNCVSYSRKKMTEKEIRRVIDLVMDLENLDDITEIISLIS